MGALLLDPGRTERFSWECPRRLARCDIGQKIPGESPWEGRGPSGPGVGCEVGNGSTPAAFGRRHPSREGIVLGS